MKIFTIASLIWLAYTSTTFATESINLDDVIVSSNRFSESNTSSASNIKVISKDDIKNSPAISIPDILRMQAGLNVSSLYGSQGIDSSVDSRGFGEAGLSNTLILLDGQRLNSVDSSSIQWASIPLAAIDHIEIISGGGSVLYGDRATGGVINIITDKSGKSAASVTGSIGSYGYKSLDGYTSKGSENIYFNTFVHTSDSNGWRRNSASNQWSVSGRGGVLFNAGDAFIDYAVYRVENGLPGSINSITLQNNPRFARNPFDFQVKDGFRVRPGVAVKLNDNLLLAAELSISQENQHFDYVSFATISDRSLSNYAFTPRLKWSHDIGSMRSTSVFGIDLYNGGVNADNHGAYANDSAKQKSQALYIQNDTAITSALDFTLGVRTQQNRQSATQLAFGDPLYYGTVAMNGSAMNTKTAYDIGLNYHQSTWSTYAKLGASFRFANTDELFGFDPMTYQPIFSGNIIKPQTAINKEVGATFKEKNIEGKVAVYYTDVKNEIGYDGNLGINTNFDPTVHQGVEVELGWKINSDVKAKFNYTYTEAKFRSGIYEGNQTPLVPHNITHAQLLWNMHGYGKYVAEITYVGERYTSGDFINTLEKLPSYTTLDLRANYDLKPLTVSISALNLTDIKYSPYAIFSSTKNDYYYFPADGRTFYLSARYDFK
jgi:iron complex outermembrane recepter protein